MIKLLEKLEDTIAIMDDILVYGKTVEEHDACLHAVFNCDKIK